MAPQEFRCSCGALLARVAHVPGTDLRIKCRKCKALNSLSVPENAQQRPHLVSVAG